MKILLLNDDGYKSHLTKELRKFLISEGHTVYSVLPRENCSCSSSRITTVEKQEIIFFEKMNTLNPELEVEGTPADCANLAIARFGTFDLCISGINVGDNAGINAFYSGTVMSAIVASSFSIPSIAVSYHIKRNRRLTKEVKNKLTKLINIALKVGKPLTYNLNFPEKSISDGIVFTSTSDNNYLPAIKEYYEKVDDASGFTYNRVSFGATLTNSESGDACWLSRGLTTVTILNRLLDVERNSIMQTIHNCEL